MVVATFTGGGVPSDYSEYAQETWLATMKDAGHYSVTNICGIDPAYTHGCGSGIRGDGFLAPFEYLELNRATALTAALVTSYLELRLTGASSTTLESITAGAPGILTLEHRNP